MSPILSRPFACVQHTSRACSYLCPQIFASTYSSSAAPLPEIFHDFVVFLYYSVATMTSTGTPPPPQ